MKKSAAPAAMIPNGKVTAETPAKTAVAAPRAPATTVALAAPKAPATTTPAPTPKAATTAAPVSDAVTTIDVKLDVGFGNAVFLRGNGGGLTWDRGIPLFCVDGKTWRWSGKVKDPVTFKLLINDKIWSAGNDLTIKPGQKIEVKPNFA